MGQCISDSSFNSHTHNTDQFSDVIRNENNRRTEQFNRVEQPPIRNYTPRRARTQESTSNAVETTHIISIDYSDANNPRVIERVHQSNGTNSIEYESVNTYLTSAQLKKLKISKINCNHLNPEIVKKGDIFSDQCSICLDDYKEGETIVKLKCSHIYHKSCLEKWLLKHNSCPYCKTEINPSDYKKN